jgi:hypothetical protein
MSAGMLAWHLRNGRAFLRCRTCAATLLRSRLVLSSTHVADFCSRACLDECVRRRLCFNCFKEPDPTFSGGYCGPCRDSYRRKLQAQRSELGKIDQAFRGISQASGLPVLYHRGDRAIA